MEHTNPWTILGEKEVYHNKWISVTQFDVINPNGGEGIYGKIHFRNLAVGVIPLDSDMHTYLVGQYRFPLNAYSWEIPEGGGDPAVDPLESAKRELLEETGLVAREWTLILKMHLSNSVSDEYAILYLARDLEQRTPMPDDTEKLAVRKLAFDEAYRMVERGEITDAMSVAVIQKVKLLLLTGQIR
jgi:8-oxo-dGTP pyrophosphatase MutT (NUDIX family)